MADLTVFRLISVFTGALVAVFRAVLTDGAHTTQRARAVFQDVVSRLLFSCLICCVLIFKLIVILLCLSCILFLRVIIIMTILLLLSYLLSFRCLVILLRSLL